MLDHPGMARRGGRPAGPLIVASQSPRRRQLLEQAGIAFETVVSGVPEERIVGESAREHAARAALSKARAVSMRRPNALVLGADTVVECEGELLGKPCDAQDARRMLLCLSGRRHTVITAFALARNGRLLDARQVESRVRFRTLAPAEIDRYVMSPEPFDKAGAYGIQGEARSFVAEIDGPVDNVMGLPVEAVISALGRVSNRRPPAGRGGGPRARKG